MGIDLSKLQSWSQAHPEWMNEMRAQQNQLKELQNVRQAFVTRLEPSNFGLSDGTHIPQDVMQSWANQSSEPTNLAKVFSLSYSPKDVTPSVNSPIAPTASRRVIPANRMYRDASARRGYFSSVPGLSALQHKRKNTTQHCKIRKNISG